MRRFNYGTWGSDPWTQVERLRAEVKRLRDEAKRLRDEAATRDRAMADLAIEIARLRPEIGGGR